jgi:hypothetical protein
VSDVFVVRGFDRVLGRINSITQDVARRAGNALRAEAEIEMTEAKRRTPVDTGALRASGHVTGPVEGTSARVENGVRSYGRPVTVWSVTLAFGGPAAPYAVKVHEDLEAWHRVGQAKFLESVVMESAPHIADRVARRLGRL